MTRDLILKFTEPQTLPRMFKSIGHGWNSWGYKLMQSGSSSRSGQPQLMQTQSGSSSRSGHNRGAVEADATDIGEQQLKQTQAVSSS